LYWAGRAALQQRAHDRAIRHFNTLADVYTNSPLMAETRFSQGDLFAELGDFSGAILAFNDIVRNHPSSPLVLRAQGRIGDCQFSLGAERPERYAEAVASFLAVLTHPQVSPELALQTEYKLGRVYERLGRREEALTHYLNVVYGWIARSTDGNAPGDLWFVRAAFSAAEMREAAGAGDEAVTIYQRVVGSGLPAAADARIRIDRIAAERQKNDAGVPRAAGAGT
jgi:TolA-binding protein